MLVELSRAVPFGARPVQPSYSRPAREVKLISLQMREGCPLVPLLTTHSCGHTASNRQASRVDDSDPFRQDTTARHRSVFVHTHGQRPDLTTAGHTTFQKSLLGQNTSTVYGQSQLTFLPINTINSDRP